MCWTVCPDSQCKSAGCMKLFLLPTKNYTGAFTQHYFYLPWYLGIKGRNQFRADVHTTTWFAMVNICCAAHQGMEQRFVLIEDTCGNEMSALVGLIFVNTTKSKKLNTTLLKFLCIRYSSSHDHYYSDIMPWLTVWCLLPYDRNLLSKEKFVDWFAI